MARDPKSRKRYRRSTRRPAAWREATPAEAPPEPEATVPTSLRLRRSLRTAIETLAEQSRRSLSDMAQELLTEAIRMRECPGIYFATEPSGRTAKIAGTGLGVWEVLSHYVKDQDLDRLRAGFHWLSPAQINAALLYYKRYPADILREVQRNDELTPEMLEARYPGLVRVVTVP